MEFHQLEFRFPRLRDFILYIHAERCNLPDPTTLIARCITHMCSIASHRKAEHIYEDNGLHLIMHDLLYVYVR